MSTATRPRSSQLRLGQATPSAHVESAPEVRIQWLRSSHPSGDKGPPPVHHVLHLSEPALFHVHRDISRGGNVGCRSAFGHCPQCARGLELRTHWYGAVKMHVVGDVLSDKARTPRWFYAVYAVPPESAAAFGFLAVEEPVPGNPGRLRRRFVPKPIAGTCRRYARKADGQIDGQPLALHTPAEVTTFDIDAVLDRSWFGQKFADTAEDKAFYEAHYVAALAHLAGPCPGPDVMGEWQGRGMPPEHVRLVRDEASAAVRDAMAAAQAEFVRSLARDYKAAFGKMHDDPLAKLDPESAELVRQGKNMSGVLTPTGRATVKRNHDQARQQGGKGAVG